MDLEVANDALALLSQSSDLFSKSSAIVEGLPLLPNIVFPTLGGKFFWNDLMEVNGWRVQKNTITGHCRILDAENKRRAWGGEKTIMLFFDRLLKR